MINNVTKKFGDKIILEEINFSFDKKTALVGLNGVGKTTLIKILVGLDNQYEGEVTIEKDVSLCLSENILPDYITIQELISSQKLNHQELLKLLDQFDVSTYKNTLIKNLSLGTQKKMNIIYSLLVKRNKIILDEPTNGLDYQSIYNLINILKKDNRDMLLVSHDFNFISKTCDNIAILYDKKIIDNDSIENILKKYSKSNLEEVFNSLVKNEK